MPYQNTDLSNLRIGSVTILVALYDDPNASLETASELGMLDGCEFQATSTENTVETDNSPDQTTVTNGGAFVASAWKNLNLEKLYLISGQAGKYETTSGAPVAVTGEPHILVDTNVTPLNKKNLTETPSLVSNIVVKYSGTTKTENTDYAVFLDSRGNTVIQRVSTGTIPDGATVTVDYSYVPRTMAKYSVGGTAKPKALKAWMINTNEKGQRFIVEAHKVVGMAFQGFSFGQDKTGTPFTMPINLILEADQSKPADENLFSLYDEQEDD